ncbi:16S rRNA (uracil(1498)-N(3))-methyltransferase [Psychrobacter sp. I-STPA10]|uniref:16S rRNA (uracil(1498)-N(3))-methyltransferase n=1 Tax=Psychrobacter sp. I-STPA10 TaxID=2585769 RepID=UPI001E3B64FA|nr:16S rRNA (uracil(1498)-N(3))-methyltransferase [Psychrobacter sp. I-STPA10]
MNCILLPACTSLCDSQGKVIHPIQSLSAHKKCITAAQAVITDIDQVTHITHVLKSQVGDTLKIGQLQGNLGTGVITKIDASSVHLANICLTKLPPAKLDLTLILALPRPKVLRRLIMDMTAIGVKQIVLLNSVRSQKSYWQSPLLKRIDEFLIEGLQQGVDTIPPTILLRQRFKPFVEDELPAWIKNKTAVIAHPQASQSFTQLIKEQGKPQLICVGAEGGWVDYEVALLQAQGVLTASLGERILRTEAAVNVLCGQII